MTFKFSPTKIFRLILNHKIFVVDAAQTNNSTSSTNNEVLQVFIKFVLIKQLFSLIKIHSEVLKYN